MSKQVADAATMLLPCAKHFPDIVIIDAFKPAFPPTDLPESDPKIAPRHKAGIQAADTFFFRGIDKVEIVRVGIVEEKRTMMYLKVSLKVCEVCGCLWFRSHENNSAYCSVCADRMKDFPKPTTKTRGRRSRKVRTAVCMGGEQ